MRRALTRIAAWWTRRSRSPAVGPGERPLLIFLSSVMTDELQWARDEVVSALSEVPFLVSWAFEHTPASSERLDDSYLRHVREAAFLVWLTGDQVTPPVTKEVHEALACRTRIIMLLLPSQGRSVDCEELIAHVRPHAKYRELAEPSAAVLRLELNLALADEIVRALEGRPGLGRLALVEERGRASRARITERFQAAGVSAPLAQLLADDVSVGAPAASAAPTLARPLVLISSDVGAGKSLHGERRHQADLERYINDATAPIPIWLAVRDASGDLEGAVRSSCEGLGDPRQQGAAIVLDGADEVGPAPAAEVLAAARVLVHTWPSTTIVLTTRPMPSFGDDSEVEHLPALSEDEARALVGRVAERGFTIGAAANWPGTISQAISRPLFAVLLGVALAEGREVPRSPAQLVATLAEKATGQAGAELEPLLRRLAVESLRRGGGPVPSMDVVTPAQLDRLIKTRLVVARGDALLFPLIIFAQWFAAAALAENDFAIDDLIAEPRDLDDWLYPLSLCAARYPHDIVSRLLGPLVREHPGFAPRVIEEALTRWGRSDVPAPPSLDAARRVRAASEAWVAGIGDLAELIAPLRTDGHLAALGARAHGPRLTLVWYRGPEQRDDVFELPDEFDLFGAGPSWGPGKMASPGAQSAWAWRWSLESFRGTLVRLLQERRLPVRGTPLFESALYGLIASVNGHGASAHEDFDVASIQRSIPESDLLVTRTGGLIPVTGVHADLQALLDRGESVIRPPFPRPDRDIGRGGWIWDPYSPGRLVERATSIFSKALESYQAYVERWFRALAPRMLTSATLPAVLHGAIHPADSSEPSLGPTIDWYLEPLPANQMSRVEFRLADQDDLWTERLDLGLSDRLKELRPRAAKWLYPIYHRSVLEVFTVYDAAELVYSWLWSDLDRIRWVDGLLGRRPFSTKTLAIR